MFIRPEEVRQLLRCAIAANRELSASRYVWSRLAVGGDENTQGKETSYPILCNKMQERLSVYNVCPPGLHRREDGIVTIDPDACVGCHICVLPAVSTTNLSRGQT
jgi:Fe-S-cluster-containing dehydrogenase component